MLTSSRRAELLTKFESPTLDMGGPIGTIRGSAGFNEDSLLQKDFQFNNLTEYEAIALNRTDYILQEHIVIKMDVHVLKIIFCQPIVDNSLYSLLINFRKWRLMNTCISTFWWF